MPAVIWLVPRMKYRLAVSGLLLHSYHDLLSSESSFLVRLLPLLLLPSCILLLFPPLLPRSADSPCGTLFLSLPFSLLQGENFFRGRHCRTFDCVGISALLLLRFPFFLFKFVFFSTAIFSLPRASFSRVFRVSSPKLSGTLASRFPFRHFHPSSRFSSIHPTLSSFILVNIYSNTYICRANFHRVSPVLFSVSDIYRFIFAFLTLVSTPCASCNSSLISSINPTTFWTLIVLIDHVYVDSHLIIIIHRQGAHRSHQLSFRERLP